MAGVFLVIMGFARLGGVIKLVPQPVIVGFTSGIALIIFSSQIKDFLGLATGPLPAEFFEKWKLMLEHISSVNGTALGIGLGTVIIMAFWPRVSHRIPGSLIALILFSAIVSVFHLDVETIGSRFGDLPHGLPAPKLPQFDLASLGFLISPAVTIALLGGIESLLSAVVADGMTGGRHRPNMELIAQGAANIASALFGGMPATGAIARTATNIKNGGRTPVAGMVHVATLLLIVLFFGRLAEHIPMACLAGILVMVSYHMSEWRSFLMLLKSPRSDVIVLIVTFLLTVVIDLVIAIQVGIVLAAFLFMKRMSEVTNVGVVTKELTNEEEPEDPNAIAKRQVPKGVEVYEINGPFFFGAAYKFIEAMSVVEKRPKVMIIRMRNVLAIDATGLHALKAEAKAAQRHGMAFLISDLHAQPLFAMDKAEALDLIGRENIFGNIDDTLNRAREILGLPRVERPVPFVPTVKREM
jgi:SulP family sulfate permease